MSPDPKTKDHSGSRAIVKPAPSGPAKKRPKVKAQEEGSGLVKKNPKMYDNLIDLRSPWTLYRSYFSEYSLREEDKVVMRKGKGRFEYYWEMVDSDGVLAGALEDHLDGVVGLPWDVIPTDEDEASLKIADFVRTALEGISKFDDDLFEILTSCVTGFSVGEVIWKDKEIDGKLMLVPDRISNRKPDLFRFGDELELRLFLTDLSKGDDTRQWPCKFIVHSFRSRSENPYGVSVLRAVYWVWWFKHNAFNYWLRAAEVGSEVTPVFRYDENASEEEIDEMAKAAQQFLKSKYIVCPNKCTIEFPHITIDPELASNLIQQCDSEMRYRILGSTLSSGTDSFGSRALGEVHEGQEQKRVEHSAKSLAECLNSTLVRWIVELNFGDTVPVPKFKLKYETDEDVQEVRENLKLAVGMGVRISTMYVAKKLSLEMAREGDELATPVEQAGGAAGGGAGGLPMLGRAEGKKVQAGRGSGLWLKVSEDHYLKLEDGIKRAGEDLVVEIRTQAVEWLKRFPDLHHAGMSAFEPDLSDLEELLAESKFLSFLHGYVDVIDHVEKTILKAQFDDEWTPVPFQKAIDLFEGRTAMTRVEFDKLEDWAKRQALTAAGMTQQTIKTRVRSGIESALRQGTTMEAFQSSIADVAMSSFHAETIFRTNVLGSYNAGAAESLYDPKMADAIPAFEFVAVMDDRTTEICAAMNGRVFSREEMLSGAMIPPLHFNCRSTIVGIFADEFKGLTTGPVSVPAQPGFGSWQPVTFSPDLAAPAPEESTLSK